VEILVHSEPMVVVKECDASYHNWPPVT